MMHDREKSDRLIVPWTPPNNAGQPAAEAVEGSGRTKGNSCDDHDARTQCRTHASTGLERVRQAASRDRQQRFTATVNWVLDADIVAFRHAWLLRVLEPRVADRRGEPSPPRPSVIRIPTNAWRSSPKVGAGCGSAARPDLWRGRGASRVPTPTETAASR